MVGESEKLYTVSVSAPGKVILHGEHSVVFGKTAVAASLGLRSSIVVKENAGSDQTLNIHLPSINIKESFQLKDITDKLFKLTHQEQIPEEHSWKFPKAINHEKQLKIVEEFIITQRPEYLTLKSNQLNGLKGILYLFSGIFGGSNVKLKPLNVSMWSELTVGAGTGSSASYAVVLSGAFIKLLKLKRSSDEGEVYQQFEEFTIEEKEIVSDWAYNCEKIMHGTPSGIDNATCTYGSIVSFRRGTRPQSLPIRLAMRVLLVDTGVARETRALSARVAALRSRNTSAVDHVMAAIDDITHTAIVVMENLSAETGRGEDEAQYLHLADLWNMNHCLLAALGVSHPSLERVRAAAAARGLACKLTGAGGGGYAIVLIPPSTENSVVDALTEDLLQQGFRFTETKLGGPGVRVEV